MKKSEAIRANYNDLIDVMVDYYRACLDSEGNMQYTVYIWSDGEVQTLESFQGSNNYLVPNDYEPRELYHVCTITTSSPWDYAGDVSIPDDPDERDNLEQEVINWLVDEYRREGAPETLDSAITEAELEE